MKILVMKTENMESDIFYEHILKKLDEGKSLKNEKNYNYDVNYQQQYDLGIWEE